MMTWRYKIRGANSTIITSNSEYAEQKSKLGYIVFCKRESNIYKFNHLTHLWTLWLSGLSNPLMLHPIKYNKKRKTGMATKAPHRQRLKRELY